MHMVPGMQPGMPPQGMPGQDDLLQQIQQMVMSSGGMLGKPQGPQAPGMSYSALARSLAGPQRMGSIFIGQHPPPPITGGGLLGGGNLQDVLNRLRRGAH
jgi:hypothetical protein